MKTYLVGGAVRDQLLGLPVKEKDWVVVGATVDDMLRKGFRQVGKDFPVFLHPETNEEYALARTERKVGRGYTGFDFNASPNVTLEDDLLRRDLTINAMAQTSDGALVDPYHGKEDLEKKLLRHVSPAFVEDPVRILRVARFAARFAELGFTVAKDTNTLMKQMVLSGEVDALVAERVWKELERALQEKHPEQFFQVLDACGALEVLFPQIKMNSTGMIALQKAVILSLDPESRFAALLHDLQPEQIEVICKRYRVPTIFKELAMLVAKHLPQASYHAEQLLALLEMTDAFRRGDRFEKFVTVCSIIADSRSQPFQKEVLLAAQAVAKMPLPDIKSLNLSGPEIKERIHQERFKIISDKLNKK
jgi:tRNA nucleotidyltransferase (CCA-adding enzyme)